MSTFDTIAQIVGSVGGLGVVGLMVRSAYRSLSKTHRQAVNADTTRDLVEVATSLIKPAEEQVTRLSARLAEAEARATVLEHKIKELETQNTSLIGQVHELKTQLVDAQLEAIRLQGLLAASGPGNGTGAPGP